MFFYCPEFGITDNCIFYFSQDIYLENPDVRWDDIIGLDTAKQLVKEAVVYPIKVNILRFSHHSFTVFFRYV